MLDARGAKVLPVPLVAIHDHPDQAAVQTWLERFLRDPPALLVLMTGEGLRRLLAAAERLGQRAAFVETLAGVETLCRGPKPERELRDLQLQPAWRAAQATTAGVIATLETLSLQGRRVCVQLYGEEPNLPLQEYLQQAGALVETVAPYVYASEEETSRVVGFIHSLAAGQVDVLAFTSQTQYRRLLDVARREDLTDTLRQGLRATVLAAVGPVVRDQLEEDGYKVAIMPERVYFMLPLVAAIEQYHAHTDHP